MKNKMTIKQAKRLYRILNSKAEYFERMATEHEEKLSKRTEIISWANEITPDFPHGVAYGLRIATEELKKECKQ